jgi:hypothetical protein
MTMYVEQSVEWYLAGELKYSEKTCISSTLCPKNSTWPDLGSNPDRRGGKLELTAWAMTRCFLRHEGSWDRPRFQAVNRQLLTTKAPGQFEDSPCWNCGGWCKNEVGHFGFLLPEVIMPMLHKSNCLKSWDSTIGPIGSAVPRHSVLHHYSDIQLRTSGQNVILLRFEPGSTRKLRRRLKI